MDNLTKLYKSKIMEYDKQINKTTNKQKLKLLKTNRQIMIEQYNKLIKNTYELV